MSELNYEKDLEINKFKLDEECEKQPLLYMKYAKAAAEAKEEFDLAWENEKVIKAQLIKEAKGTAQEKEAYYRTHKEHIKAKEEKIEAEKNWNIINAAVFAFSQRKTALENLVKLWAGEYFSEPAPERVPRQKLEEESSRRVKRKIRTKTREE